MRGYCEACRREMQSEEDEYGASVCVDCGSDLLADMHVMAEYEDDDEDEDEFEINPFFRRD